MGDCRLCVPCVGGSQLCSLSPTIGSAFDEDSTMGERAGVRGQSLPCGPLTLTLSPAVASVRDGDVDRGGEGTGISARSLPSRDHDHVHSSGLSLPVSVRNRGQGWQRTAFRALAKLLLAMLLLHAPRVWAQNFSVAEPELRTAAESARECSARFWSGRSLPGAWSAPCPVHWSTRSGPGSGLTCFQIQNGEVFGWQMTLRGDRDTVLRDVLPHEVDHAVRASLCRRPLPRWLDEGCATLFESETSHESLRRQRQASRVTRLTPTTIDQLSYPATSDDTARLYAEGFSFVEYLLSRGTPHDLLRVQLATEPPSRSLVKVYRTELPQLLTGWRAWEQKRLTTRTRCDCVNCPWHRRPTGPTRPSQPTASPRPTLTIWTASWCAPCQQFHRDLASDAGFRSRLESQFQLVVRDVDQSQSLAAPQGIRSVPVFITPNQRVEGYLGPEWLLKQLGLEESVTPPVPPAVTHP